MPILAEQLDFDPDDVQIPELGCEKRCKIKSTRSSTFYDAQYGELSEQET
jgi:hypothetical protein